MCAPRFLLALASLILVFSGAVHSAAFGKARAAVAAVNLPPFYANSFKTLWLIDSSWMFVLAAAFGFIAARPASASGSVVMLMALLPVAVFLLVWWFLGGNFLPAYLLLGSAVAAFVAGLMLP